MEVRNNYNECLTNLACSIRKYFGLAYHHNTLEYIDRALVEYAPKNVVVILCDGMGSNILQRALRKDDFLVKNLLKPIYTVFPATTVAATTSMMTGLNPCETNMLGWDMYYKDLDKVVTVFHDHVQGDASRTPLQEAVAYREQHMIRTSITDEINEAGLYAGHCVSPYSDEPYQTLNEMFNMIAQRCESAGKKYIYAYCEEPDHTMHVTGCDSKKARRLIRYLNKRIERLVGSVHDTMLFVVADHGHHSIQNVRIDDYPDLAACLMGSVFLEPRAPSFFVRPGMEGTFVELFTKYFGNDFELWTKEEVIESQLFGDGIENEVFRDSLGDYLAIAVANKALLNGFGRAYKSHHAGYTDDEILVPLIVARAAK